MTAHAILARRARLLLWLAITAGGLLLVGANAHLVYVAAATQPDCVAHARAGEGAAAQSSCPPDRGDR